MVNNLRRPFAKFAGGLSVVLAVIGVVFVGWGCGRSRRVVPNAVRRSGRATKPLVLKSSGTPGGIAVRWSATSAGPPVAKYATPVQAVATGDGFAIVSCCTG